MATSYRDTAEPQLIPKKNSFVSLYEPSPTRREVQRLTLSQEQVPICRLEQHTVWSPTNSLCKLTSFLKPNITGGCTNETGDSMTIMELERQMYQYVDEQGESQPTSDILIVILDQIIRDINNGKRDQNLQPSLLVVEQEGC
jgi:hypothetical protein